MENKKVGRPRLSKGSSKNVTFRLSEEEFKLFETYTQKIGIRKSTLLREYVLRLLKESNHDCERKD